MAQKVRGGISVVEVLPFATEQELADHYLMKLDPARFSTLIQKLENDELLGAENRPVNIAEAYTVASNWRGFRNVHTSCFDQ